MISEARTLSNPNVYSPMRLPPICRHKPTKPFRTFMMAAKRVCRAGAAVAAARHCTGFEFDPDRCGPGAVHR